MNPYKGMPNKMVCNYYNNEMIQKCGFNIEELDFGEINEPKNKSFILYNYSNKNSFNFDFIEPGFLVRDELIIQPNRGIIEAGKYKLIKCKLNPLPIFNSEYEGDILVKISWNKDDDNFIIPKSPQRRSAAQYKSGNNTTLFGSNTAISKVHTIQRENLYLRVAKKGVISETFGNLSHKETTANNSSFVEILLKDLTKQIISSNEFKNNFTKQMNEQPLTIYKWTNNETLPSLGKLREKYISNLKLLIVSQLGDLSNDRSYKKGKSFIDSRLTHSRMTTSQIHSNKQITSNIKDIGVDLPKIEEINESVDNEIQEKYIKDLLVKYKYTIKEANEKIILTNDETKKLICDTIMENTIFNIISQTVYGEIDLTLKPRIYFFLGKGNNYLVNESANLGVSQSGEFNNGNNLIKSENNIGKINEEIKINESDKINTSKKEEDAKENNTNVSKNSKKSAIKSK